MLRPLDFDLLSGKGPVLRWRALALARDIQGKPVWYLQ